MKHNEMMKAMVELKNAINKAYKISEREFMNSLKDDEQNTFWFNTMFLLEAMNKIKCAIDIQPEI